MLKNKLIKTLLSTIDSLEEELKIEKAINKENSKNLEILLTNNMELRNSISDLENNLEFIINQLSSSKKKLINK